MARSREFDPQQALDKAMHQFWAKGYHDTSIRDLVTCTGVNYYGLYSVFESKHGLFLAALDHYRDTVTAELIRELERPGFASSKIRRAFGHLLGRMKTPCGRIGCLVGNTAVELAPYDTDAAAKVRAHMKLLTEAFAATLSRGRDAGELCGTADINAQAEFLASTAYCLGTLLRAGCSDAHVRRHLNTALSTIE